MVFRTSELLSEKHSGCACIEKEQCLPAHCSVSVEDIDCWSKLNTGLMKVVYLFKRRCYSGQNFSGMVSVPPDQESLRLSRI